MITLRVDIHYARDGTTYTSRYHAVSLSKCLEYPSLEQDLEDLKVGDSLTITREV